MPFKNLLFFCLMIGSILKGGFCVAQKSKLSNVAKLDLVTEGAWDGYYQKVEIVPENGQWRSYQTRLVNNRLNGRPKTNDSTRTFIKNVSAKELEQFIVLIAKPDPVIRQKLFNIKPGELMAQLDSNIDYDLIMNKLNICPPPEWRNKFAKAVNSKPLIADALYDMFHLRNMIAEKSYCTIMVTDKLKKTDTIKADATFQAYHLPWKMKGGESFNPNITRLFELMVGKGLSEKHNRHSLNYQLVSELYDNHTFKSVLAWERFRSEQPDMYKQVSKTLIPLKNGSYIGGQYIAEIGYGGIFISKRLPSFIQLDLGFSRERPESIDYSNKLENKFVTWYKRGNFLFDVIRKHPHYRIILNRSVREELYAEVVKCYPDISKFERSKVTGFAIMESAYSHNSSWLLLPDDKVILIGYNGKLSNNYGSEFEIISPDEYGRDHKYVCIVFDKFGKKIGGTEGPFEVKKPDL